MFRLGGVVALPWHDVSHQTRITLLLFRNADRDLGQGGMGGQR